MKINRTKWKRIEWSEMEWIFLAEVKTNGME